MCLQGRWGLESSSHPVFAGRANFLRAPSQEFLILFFQQKNVGSHCITLLLAWDDSRNYSVRHFHSILLILPIHF